MYSFDQAADLQNIDGGEYGAGANLATTVINSCLLVVGRTAGGAAAIHVAFTDKRNREFDRWGVWQVADKMHLMNATGSYAVCGAVGAWRGAAGYSDHFRSMVTALGIPAANLVDTADGVHQIVFVAPGTVRVTDGDGVDHDFAL